MRNHEVINKHSLLDENGSLIEPGWSRSLIQSYDRNMIKKRKTRIKEWDYYYIINDDFALALTIADNSYMGLDSISFIHFGEDPWEQTKSPMQFFTMGSKHLPNSPEGGSVSSKGGSHSISFRKYGDIKKLSFNFKNFMGKTGIEGEITLSLPE